MPQPSSPSYKSPGQRQSPWAALAVGLALLLILGLLDRFAGRGNDPPPQTSAQPEATPSNSSPAAKQNETDNSQLVIRNIRILDEDKRVVYYGDVDLRPTLARIDRGERLRFPNDGAVFENRERRLPRQPRGYYLEFVHPTPNQGGPGAQRVVIGQEAEVYYTPDHYRTFRRVR